MRVRSAFRVSSRREVGQNRYYRLLSGPGPCVSGHRVRRNGHGTRVPTARGRRLVSQVGSATPGASRQGPQRSQMVKNMKRRTIRLILPLLGSLIALPAEIPAAGNPSPEPLIEWSSEESVERLSRSSHKADFFPLSNHFISQDNKIFCGPVSSAIVLNALRLGRLGNLPEDRQSIANDELVWLPEGFNPFFGKYTPNNVLDDRTKRRIEVLGKPIRIDGILKSDFGLQLGQLAQVLLAQGLDVKVRVVDEHADTEDITREIAANLAARDDFVLVNYSRQALGQEGGGHISPLGAYDKRTDSFLIMDVNPNRAPWVWVGSDDLVRAMRTFDTVENRGYLLVSDSK